MWRQKNNLATLKGMRQEEDQDETVESRDIAGVTVLSFVRIRNLWRLKGIGALKYSSGSVQLQSI